MAKMEARKGRAKVKGQKEPGATEQSKEMEPPARLNVQLEGGAKQENDSKLLPVTGVICYYIHQALFKVKLKVT